MSDQDEAKNSDKSGQPPESDATPGASNPDASPENEASDVKPSGQESGSPPQSAESDEAGVQNDGQLSATTSDDSPAAGDTADTPESGDELPEDEELTPELVEEEAIRGDFMLRWAAIFLAVLFGFSQISDSRVLVHIRSGEAMRAGAILPFGSDPHSYMLEGQSVSNVSWLLDHVVSLVYSIGGESGLTIFKALAAGAIAYLLSLISLKGMPTWWSSICCVLAVAACSVDFIPGTDLATLLGLSIILLFLHHHSEGLLRGGIWKIPVTIAIWSNFDPHAYMGVLAVALYATGAQMQRSLSQQNEDGPLPETSFLWKTVGLALAALLINPSPLASLTSVVTTYSVDYPTMARLSPLLDGSGNPVVPELLLDGRTEFHSILSEGMVHGFELAWVAGLALIVIAIVVLAISRSREDLPWGVLFGGFSLLLILAMHELPAAALVAAVAAGISAQRWYGRKFSQEYTIKPSEVLFSRGGRAVTVFAFAALSFVVVADRLPTRSPIGFGFEQNLKTTMETLEDQLAELPEDAQILHTVLNQGDLLIWHGRKSFIDSRVTPFGSYSDAASPLHKFEAYRWSIIRPPSDAPAPGAEADSAEQASEADSEDDSGRPFDEKWKQHLTELCVTHAMIRLAPPGVPAYNMAGYLLRSPEWIMSHRGPSAMFFSLVTDRQNPPKSIAITNTAFRNSEAEEMEQPEFARARDFYQKYLYASRNPLTASLREAQHYLTVDCQIPAETVFQIAKAAAADPSNEGANALLGTALAGPLLSIRNAARAIFEDPQNALAHRIRGDAYNRLSQTESAIAAAYGGTAPTEMRYLQSVMAFRQAVTIQPEDSMTWQRLMSLYQSRNRTGLALDCLNKLLELEEEQLAANPDADAQLRQFYEMQRTWEERRENVQAQVDEILVQDMPEDPQQQAARYFQIVQQLQADGHLKLAVKLGEDKKDLLLSIPPFQLMYGQMLMECGKLEEGALMLSQLAAIISENPRAPDYAGMQWHFPVAVSHLARGDYPGASDVWAEQISLFAEVLKAPQLSRNVMQSLPIIPAVQTGIGGEFSAWPLAHLQTANVPLTIVPTSRYEPSFLRAMSDVESGNVANAKFVLEGLVSDGGAHTLRALAAVYLRQLSDDGEKLLADSTLDMWEDFEFPTIDDSAGDANDTEDQKDAAGDAENAS